MSRSRQRRRALPSPRSRLSSQAFVPPPAASRWLSLSVPAVPVDEKNESVQIEIGERLAVVDDVGAAKGTIANASGERCCEIHDLSGPTLGDVPLGGDDSIDRGGAMTQDHAYIPRRVENPWIGNRSINSHGGVGCEMDG
jgi:hypothetical protein